MVEDESDLIGADWYLDELKREISRRPLEEQIKQYEIASQTAHFYTPLDFDGIERFRALCNEKISQLEDTLGGSFGC